MCEGPEPQRCLGRVQPGFCPPHTLVKDMKAMAMEVWDMCYGTSKEQMEGIELGLRVRFSAGGNELQDKRNSTGKCKKAQSYLSLVTNARKPSPISLQRKGGWEGL